MKALRVPQTVRSEHRWTAAALLGTAGFLLNLLAVPLSPGVDLLFGGTAYLLAAVALGPGAGLLAAVIAAAPTLWLWNHPYAWLIFSLEGLMVGVLVTRWGRRPLTAAVLYWLLLGVPLLFLTYGGILGVSGLTATIIFLKQPFNGLINALAVEALLLLPTVRRSLGEYRAPRLRAALAVVVSVVAIAPVLVVGIWEVQQQWRASVERAEERVVFFAQAHAARTDQYILLHERAVRSVAEASMRRGEFDPNQLQRLLAAEYTQFPGFLSMYAAGSNGTTVAFESPLASADRSLIGLNFSDREYFRQLQETRSTVVSEVFAGRGGADEPIIIIAHPIILADTFAGFVLGALDLKKLPSSIPLPLAGERVRIADTNGTLVFDSNAPYQSGDRPRSVTDSIAFQTVRTASEDGTATYLVPGTAVAAASVASGKVLAGVARIRDLGWWVWVEHPFSRIEAFVARSYALLLATLITIILATVLLSNLLAGWLADPLLRVRQAAAHLASGNLRTRVGILPEMVPDEVAEMASGFDEMAESLERHTEELEELSEIARSLASTLDTDDLLRQITDATARLVEADGCGIALLEPDRQALRVARYSMGLLMPMAGTKIPLDRSLNGWVVQKGEPALVYDAAADPRVFRENARMMELGSVICAPLIGRSGPLGALTAVRAHSRAEGFTADHLQLLERLARHAAIAVENAHLVAEAQAASRAKSDFIATMSHELRTPLNAVLGHLQLLQMGIHGEINAKQHETLERIAAASTHLRGLIEEVLSFARLEAGRTEVRIADTDLCALAEEVGGVIEPLAAAKGLRLQIGPCLVADAVATDSDRVRQILINLAGNAVKFTERGEVRIRAEEKDGEVVLAVADTGPGIAAEDQARLFRPFEQLVTGLSRPHEGTGLGLYLSRQYAELIGGRIELDSTVGEGSTFSLVLPRQAQVHDPAVEDAPAESTPQHADA